MNYDKFINVLLQYKVAIFILDGAGFCRNEQLVFRVNSDWRPLLRGWFVEAK